MDSATYYSKVAVLIVRWIEELDKYAEGHDQEVSIAVAQHRTNSSLV